MQKSELIACCCLRFPRIQYTVRSMALYICYRVHVVSLLSCRQRQTSASDVRNWRHARHGAAAALIAGRQKNSLAVAVVYRLPQLRLGLSSCVLLRAGREIGFIYAMKYV